jgi:hypothetical protein
VDIPIFEVPVFDGATKAWRVLNLSTGTVYSNGHESLGGAQRAIRAESERDGRPVRFLTIGDVRDAVVEMYAPDCSPDDSDDGDYIAARVAERDNEPPSPFD